MENSLINLGDSYKYGHSGQYPANAVSLHSYMESRGGMYDEIVFVGLQYYLMEFLSKPITVASVRKAERRAKGQGIPFDTKGWMYIATELEGKFPVSIKAVPEGTLVPIKVVPMTITSTDKRVPWAEGFIETLLMKLWYPITVATKSREVRKMLEKYGSVDWAQFAYHNFGDRSSTTVDAAAIGSFGHLTQLLGTDNFNSLDFCEEYYGVPEDEVAGYSVFATEHSTTTSYGRNGEEQFVYDQLIANPNRPIMSFVIDSYDPYAFTEFCTAQESRIRKLIESRPHQKLVLRPDSGEPIEVLSKMLNIMKKNNLVLVDSYRTLYRDFGILWGDGITPEVIENILKYFTEVKDYAAENFVFGSGGDLMQNVNRDTQKFAIKCSSITLEFEGPSASDPESSIGTQYVERDVFKDPITDPGKASKRGRVTTYLLDGKLVPGIEGQIPVGGVEALVEVFRNGEILRFTTLAEIRELQ